MVKVQEENREVSPIFIGIDPGKSGGLVTLQGSGRGIGVDYSRMPETEFQLWEWFYRRRIMFERAEAFAVIEKVTSSPQMGVASAFTFGRGYGCLRMCLIACGVPFEEVRPQVWQKSLLITPRKKKEVQGKWKSRLAESAQRLFPALPLWQETKGMQLAVADSLLIAEYCRRNHGSKD